MKYKEKQFENIYDIICRTTFENEARIDFDKFLKGKEVEWDGDNNIISVGKRFKIKLIKQ